VESRCGECGDPASPAALFWLFGLWLCADCALTAAEDVLLQDA
jgi:hypothetical protein